jgi:hypothetical protein
MKEVLDDLENGRYKRLMVKSNSLEDNKEGIDEDKSKKMIAQAAFMDNSLNNQGEIIRSDKIIFDKVPILSPNGDTLIKEMSFEI